MAPVPVWPLAVYVAISVALVAGILGLSHFLGERNRDAGVSVPFESGILPTGSARLGLSARFYVVGILFVIFDVEAVFLFAWALIATDLGWPAFGAALVFTVLLLVALLYVVRSGALDMSVRRTAGAGG